MKATFSTTSATASFTTWESGLGVLVILKERDDV